MNVVRIEDVVVDRCTACSGLWLDAHERERLLAAGAAAKIDVGDAKLGRQLDQLRSVPCPRCSGRMVSMVDADHPDVHFEQCAACGGSYLDAGELRELSRSNLRTLLTRLVTF